MDSGRAKPLHLGLLKGPLSTHIHMSPKEDVLLDWPKEDLTELIRRMEVCIPENDTLSFHKRVEKLQWDAIVFKNYTIEDCKKTWVLLQKKIRRYRLLKEVLEDAKEWVCSPKLPRQKGKIRLQHPDMPRKPLSAYFLYYTKKREVFQKAHPGLDAVDVSKQLAQEYKNLPIDKRLKYETLQAKAKQEYQQKLELFYKNHPEIPRQDLDQKRYPVNPSYRNRQKKKPPPKERIPKKTSPPFQYYYLSELDKADKTVEDKAAFKEECKERWKLLNDREKITWINYAEQQYNQYEESMKTYMQNHPDYKQNPAKPILTKEDIQIKERSAGKPSKPPNSSYSHYARLILQSDEIKDVPVRDRLVYVANKWKTVPEEHKKQLKEQVTKMNKQYKIEFAGYLENLPEEERKRELQKNMPKRPQKKTPEKKNGREKRIRSPKKKKWRIQSAYKYFASMYTGEEPVAQAWKVLTPEQKEVYEDDLVKKKRDYIANFEKFLKSLTKEELEAFSNSRSQSKKNVEDDDDEEDEESSNESGTEDSGSDSAEEGLADEEGAVEEEDAE
ncbi:hypothetical protein NQ317_007012 [Molorchus minor]|uniref:HMG box domain-containing protein n=1 Tax=Molorchus minor TaxID=1323400 RepID=A0ABQ9JT61_9CUCU|nr:hypothetical protein NQ317_007012 [Molorchus minor]